MTTASIVEFVFENEKQIKENIIGEKFILDDILKVQNNLIDIDIVKRLHDEKVLEEILTLMYRDETGGMGRVYMPEKLNIRSVMTICIFFEPVSKSTLNLFKLKQPENYEKYFK